MPFFERKTPRDRKKHTGAYYAAMVFTCVIEFALGTNAAFLMYQNFKVTVYSMISMELWANVVTIILAFAFGAGVFAGGMWTFAGFIDNLDDAKAYKNHYHSNGWPISLIWAGLLLVVVLDFTTLMFRVAYFNEKGALSLFAFFCVLIVLPPVLGPLIHVLENTPRNRREAKIRQYAERLDIDGQEKAIRDMSPALRAKALSNDPREVNQAFQEYYQGIDDEKSAQYAAEGEKIRIRQEGEARKNQGFAKEEDQYPLV